MVVNIMASHTKPADTVQPPPTEVELYLRLPRRRNTVVRIQMSNDITYMLCMLSLLDSTLLSRSIPEKYQFDTSIMPCFVK